MLHKNSSQKVKGTRDFWKFLTNTVISLSLDISAALIAQKMHFSIKDFFSKSNQIRRKLCAVSLVKL